MDKSTLKFPGSIEHFRALIDELRVGNQYRWTSSKDETFAVWDYFESGNEKKADDKTSTWEIVLQDEDNLKQSRRKQGVIQAFESLPNITSVNFYDGKSFSRFLGFQDAEKIGESFEELIRSIRALWEDKSKDNRHSQSKAAIVKIRKIDPLVYPSSIAHFRAWMDRYLAQEGNGFSVMTLREQRDYKVSHMPIAQTSTREVWHVQSIALFVDGERSLEVRHGLILASEELPNKTVVEFIDGEYYKTVGGHELAIYEKNPPQNLPPAKAELTAGTPIGEDFIQLAESIKSKFESENQIGEVEHASEEPRNKLLNKIEPVEYSGLVHHFRAWMDRFLAVHGKAFGIAEGTQLQEYSVSYYAAARNSTREVWNVVPESKIINGKSTGDSRVAMILAVEESPDRTLIEFLDGQCYEKSGYKFRSSSSEPKLGEPHLTSDKPIGDDFIKIAEQIKAAWAAKHNEPDLIQEELEIEVDGGKSYQKPKQRSIETVEYPDSVEHFRAWMDRFIAVHGRKFPLQPGSVDYYISYEKRLQTSTREVWKLYSSKPLDRLGGSPDANQALILATEILTNKTTIEFLDGMTYYQPTSAPVPFTPIGADFTQLVDIIKEALAPKVKDNQTSMPQEPKTNNLSDWFTYFHQVKHLIRITLRDIAKKTGYSYDYVREKHGQFIKEREEGDLK